jgi:hypothetical protein
MKRDHAVVETFWRKQVISELLGREPAGTVSTPCTLTALTAKAQPEAGRKGIR